MWNLLNRRNTCLLVQWTRPLCRYVLAERGSLAPRVLEVGSFETDDSQPVAEQLRQHAASQNVRCRQAVLLLPRAELDVSSLNLPPATKAELPELVSSAVALETDDAADTRVSDFLVTHQDDAACETLVFSSDETAINQFKSSFRTAGLNLLGITFSGMGTVELLRHLAHRPPSTAVVVGTSDYDIDLAVQANGHSVLVRTIPYSSEEGRVFAERLEAEIRRTLALAHRADDDSTRVYLIGAVREHEQLAQMLSDQLSFSVSVVNPLDQVKSAVEVDYPSRYANLLGVACAWNGGGFELDLLNPRRSPQKPGPWRRVAFWGAIAASVLLVIGYIVGKDRADQIGAINQQMETLERLQKRANKARALQDGADVVHAWRQDDIAWLDELRELSERLPSQDQALIRRMSMSTDSQGNGVVDLAVQVNQPEVVANLEDAVRDERHSVSSKRVTESDESAKLPWAFETRIVFKPADVPELPLPDELVEKDDEATEAAEEPRLVATDAEQEGSRE